MTERALHALLTTSKLRIYALERYLEARAALIRTAKYLSELREADWLRVWAPGRERILVSGELTRVSASKERPLRLGTLSLNLLSSWFERRFPAGYAPVS